MKKFLIFTLIVLISVSNYAQNKEKPLNIYIKGLGRLQKVEQNQEATIFHFEKMVAEAGKPFLLPNNLKVRNQMNNHFYSLIKVENAPNSEILSQKNAIYQYQLFFEPIDKQSTSLQVINDEKELSLGKPFQTLSRFFYLNKEEEIKKTSIKPLFSDISVEKALLRAEKENKKVLIYFKKRNHYASRWIENQIFSNEGIQKALSDHYIRVVANLNTHRGIKRDRNYGMKYFPSVVKLNEKGESIEEINTSITQEEFLNFLMKNETQPLEDKPFTLEIPKEKNTKMKKRQSLSLSVGVNNSQISDFSSKIRTAVTTDLLYSVDYDKKYLWRTGLRFTPKGSYHLPINYLQIPLELGWTAYETSLSDFQIRFRLLASPYYALRISGKAPGVSTNDYGINFGIAPEIGSISKLSLLFYYEHGGKDILSQVSGFQRNQSFGVRAILTF